MLGILTFFYLEVSNQPLPSRQELERYFYRELISSQGKPERYCHWDFHKQHSPADLLNVGVGRYHLWVDQSILHASIVK